MTTLREARDRLAWGGSPPELQPQAFIDRLNFRGWTISDGRHPAPVVLGHLVDLRFRDKRTLMGVEAHRVFWHHRNSPDDVTAWRWATLDLFASSPAYTFAEAAGHE